MARIVKFTEFDKAILLGVLILSKGAPKLVSEKTIVMKFPARQRKSARLSLQKLVRLGFLRKAKDKFQLTERGVREARKLLVEGAPIWGTS